jgi:hypothetical protein
MAAGVFLPMGCRKADRLWIAPKGKAQLAFTICGSVTGQQLQRVARQLPIAAWRLL